MNIYNLLKSDHKKVATLLDRLVASSEAGNEDWKSLVNEIRDELIPHARAEEALFYNPIRSTEHGKGVILHAYGEHAKAETELRTLQAMTAIDANWTALAKKLRHDLLHHVEEEEGKVFTVAKEVFTNEEADQIGAAFEALKPYVKKQSFGGTTLDLIQNLLPRRWVESIRGAFGKTPSSDQDKKKSA